MRAPPCGRGTAGTAALRALIVLSPALLAPSCGDRAAPTGGRTSAASPAGAPSHAGPLVGEEFLESYAATRRFTLGQPQGVSLAPKGEAVLFLRSGPRSPAQDLYSHDVATGEERALLTAEAILGGREEKLSAEESARRERMRMTSRGIASYSLSADGNRILVPLSGRLFVVERAGGAVKELPPGAPGSPIDPRFSPDGSRVSFVREGDLHVTEIESGRERRLTVKSGPAVENGLAEFVAQEEMDRMQGYWWSPAGDAIACQETDTAGMELFHIADPSRPEVEPRAWPYPRAGKRNAVVRLRVIPLEGPPAPWVEWDRERYPYLAAVSWEEDAPLAVLVQNREQTEETLLEVDPRSGATRVLLVEKDPAWLNLHPPAPRWLPGGGGFLWVTERAGDTQLEIRGRDGRLERALNEPGFGLIELLGVDGDGRWATVLAARDSAGRRDPTVRQVWRLAVKDPEGEAEAFTSDAGLHRAVFAEEAPVCVVASQLLSGELSWTVRKRVGGLWESAGRLRSVAESPPFLPRVELTVVGGREYRAAVVRPRDFDPRRRYPVLVSVYGGPRAQTVMAGGRSYLLPQWFSDQGFVVVSIDGRGTPARGREWERAIKGDLIQAPLEDQAAGLAALGERYPEIDLARAGIYGWSFGGYFSAMAVLRRPDVYRAAAAGAPVADWLDYDTHYTERYMGLPDRNPEGYRECSVLAHAGKLSRPFLITHGTADDNVYFLHGLKMAWELFRAGKSFEFAPLAGYTHVVADPPVVRALNARIARFFRERLGGPEGR